VNVHSSRMFLAFLLCAAAPALAQEVVPPGTPIVAVTIVRRNVFDTKEPATSSWPYRAADALHIVSREGFIRSLLLFHVGDPLDPGLLAESERALRATGFLSPVTIRARPAPGGAEVVVETRDQWTTEAAVNYGLAGSQQKFGFSLTEENLLGWGKELQLLWKKDPERTSLTTIYADPVFLGSRWTLDLVHSNASDGKLDKLQLEYPFYALSTPRAGGVLWQRSSLLDYLWSGGDKQVSGESLLQSFRLWGGIRLPGGPHTTNRVTLGIFEDRASFDNWAYLDGRPYQTPADRDLVGPEIGFGQESDRWEVITGFRSWSRQEDVPLGPNWHVNLGVSLPAFGGDASRLRLSSDLTLGWLSGRQYTWLNGVASGRLDNGKGANEVFHLEVGTALTGSQGFRARLAADLSHALDRENQLTLGADTGLRGWDPNTFDGTDRAVANLEYRRRLTGEVLHLGIIGMALFADAGRTWNPRVGPDTGGVRFDAGAGLTVEITRAAILHIVRVEVGFPDKGHGPIFLITGVSLF
jgi:hypothetical protein